MHRVLAIILAVMSLMVALAVTSYSIALQRSGVQSFDAVGKEIALLIVPIAWIASLLAIVACRRSYHYPNTVEMSTR
jgi:hypothetical protein